MKNTNCPTMTIENKYQTIAKKSGFLKGPYGR